MEQKVQSQFWKAIEEDQGETVRAFLDADRQLLALKNATYGTPLHYAIKKGQKQVFRPLWEAALTSDIEAVDPDGYTLLHLMARHNRITMMEQAIAFRPPKVHDQSFLDAQDLSGKTALHYAVRHEDGKIATMLLGLGADVTIVSHNDHLTALHESILKGAVKTIQLLLTYKANLYTKDPEGKDCLDLLDDPLTLIHESIKQKVYCEPLLQAIAQKHPDFQKRSAGIGSLLHRCATDQQVRIAAWLLGQGCDVNATNESFYTPLHISASIGDIEMIQLLLRHGADKSYKARYGETPLDKAKKHHRSAAIDLLEGRVHPSSVVSTNPADPARSQSPKQPEVTIQQELSLFIQKNQEHIRQNVLAIPAMGNHADFQQRDQEYQGCIAELKKRIQTLENQPSLDPKEIAWTKQLLAQEQVKLGRIHQQKDILMDPSLRDFYLSFQSQLNAVYLGSMAVVSGMASNDYKNATTLGRAQQLIEAIGDLGDNVPGLKIITFILGKGMDLVNEQESRKTLLNITDMAPGASSMEKIAEELARKISLEYAGDLQNLARPHHAAASLGVWKERLQQPYALLTMSPQSSLIDAKVDSFVKAVVTHAAKGTLKTVTMEDKVIELFRPIEQMMLGSRTPHSGRTDTFVQKFNDDLGHVHNSMETWKKMFDNRLGQADLRITMLTEQNKTLVERLESLEKLLTLPHDSPSGPKPLAPLVQQTSPSPAECAQPPGSFSISTLELVKTETSFVARQDAPTKPSSSSHFFTK